MSLSTKSLALTSSLVWGGALFTVGMINLAAPRYGAEFLRLMSSVYPGYRNSRRLPDVLTATGYALVDGAIGGLMFAWLYNRIAGADAKPSTPADSSLPAPPLIADR